MSAMNNVATLHRNYDWVHDVPTEMDAVVGDLSAIHLKGQDVLVGVYIRPSKYYMRVAGSDKRMMRDGKPVELHAGGTGKEAVEDVYQGKCVRILKLAPQAFDVKTFPSLRGEWGESNLPQIGDWVICRANDGLACSVKGPGSRPTTMFDDMEKMPSNGGWPCRIVAFSDIIMRVADPAVVV